MRFVCFATLITTGQKPLFLANYNLLEQKLFPEWSRSMWRQTVVVENNTEKEAAASKGI
jgi:hypothetical protein